MQWGPSAPLVISMLNPVAQTLDAFGLGAVIAAEKRAVLLDAVSDDADAAMLAGRRQRVDSAFKTVEGRARDNPVNAEKWGKFTFCGGDDFALQPWNRLPRYWRGEGITEADMIGFLKGTAVGTIIFLGSPAFAADIAIGRGIICDTQEQMERYVAVFKGSAKEALTTVNTEAKKEDACAAAVVAYLAGDTAATARNNDGDAFRVLKILVLGVVTDMGVQQVAPFPQFTIMKIDEISI